MGTVAYFNSFNGVFVYDDLGSIVENPGVYEPKSLSHAMSLSMVNSGETIARRPLLALSFAFSFALNQKLFDGDPMVPFGFHLTNLVIHISAALLLFGIVRRTLDLKQFAGYRNKAFGLALAIGLIWLVHPLQTESVTYIAQRAESLCGMFYLLTLYCSVRGFTHAHKRRANTDSSLARRFNVETKWFLAATVACAAGMAVKEVMVTAPILVFLYDGSFISKSYVTAIRKRWLFYSALMSTWIIVLVLQTMGFIDVSKDFTDRSPIAYALTQPGVILYYLRLSVWPSPLVMDYNWPTATSLADIVLPGFIVALPLGATGWGLYHRRWYGFVGAWFFLILAPSSSFAALMQNLEEHRMYLSLVAVVVLIVFAADRFVDAVMSNRPPKSKQTGRLLILLTLVFWLTSWTISRNADYRSETDLWGSNVRHRPQSWTAQNNFGSELLDEGRFEAAIEPLETALELMPDVSYVDRASVHFNIGNAKLGVGRINEALIHYQAATNDEPDSTVFLNGLGIALAQTDGRIDEAITAFQRAAKIDPTSVDIQTNLAQAFLEKEQLEDAVEHAKQALKIDPFFWKAHVVLGKIYMKQCNRDKAIDHFRRALELEPNAPGVYKMLQELMKSPK